MKFDNNIEKNIIKGMISNDRFLREMTVIYHKLKVDYMDILAGWCLEYFKQYQKAPQNHIKDIFTMQSKTLSEDYQNVIGDFLSIILSEEDSFNIEYILDTTEKYFRSIRLEELKEKFINTLNRGNIDRAENLIKNYERIVRPETAGVNPFDKNVIIEAFSKETGDELFSFPGELGKIINYFERETLVSLIGVRGTGKTWWLLWIALLAAHEGYKTIFVSLEMSKKQIIRRIHQHYNVTFHDHDEESKSIPIPKFVDEETSEVVLENKNKKGISLQGILKRASRIKKNNLKLLFYPSGTTTMNQFDIQLQNMEYYDNFIPDVIITDYADKFRSEKKQGRYEELSSIWEAHKALAQKRKCLVVTASQSNTARSGKDIGQGSMAECIAKEDQSDLILALNQTAGEKENGIMRIKLTKHRHRDFSMLKEIVITQCYDIGRPYIDSRKKNS